MKAWKQHNPRYAYLLGGLLLSDRVDEVIKASEPQEVRLGFELLVAQGRMREAFQLVKVGVPISAKTNWTAWLKDGKGTVSQDRLWLACLVVRSLHVAGADEQAHELTAAILAVVGRRLPEDGWEVFALKLMEVEVAVGRAESCDALAVKLLALDLENPEVVIARLYRDQDTIAVLLWKALRSEFRSEDRPTALRHLRRLLTGKPDATAVDELTRLVLRVEPQLEVQQSDDSPDDETSDPQARKLLALATLFQRYGQSKLAAKYLARIAPRGVSRKDVGRPGQPVRGREAMERSRQVVRGGLDQGSPQRGCLVSLGLGANQARRGGRRSQAYGIGPGGSPVRRRNPP